MSILDTILGRGNKSPLAVPTPEWPELDGTLAVRRLSPAERVEFYSRCAAEQADSGAAFVTFMAVYCAVLRQDPSPIGDKRAFEDGDWKALSADAGSGAAVERLADAADELNILSGAARESLKKRYAQTTASDSSSASPDRSESPSVSSSATPAGETS